MKPMSVGIIAIVACALVAAVLILPGCTGGSTAPTTPGTGAVNPESFDDFGSFTVRRSGDSEGSEYELKVIRTNKTTVGIRLTTVAYNGAPKESKGVDAGQDFIDQVNTIMQRVGMPSWNEAEFTESEVFALDAPTTYVTYLYGGVSHSFSSDKNLPEGGWAAVWEMVNLAESLALK